MTPSNPPQKSYDLEDRTFRFAKNVRDFLKSLNSSPIFFEDKKQLLRSSGSVGANFIEANEAISPKDFHHRIKICKKEAKESQFWLRLIEAGEPHNTHRKELIQESIELTKIFGAISKKFR